jgi:hypothetical protein
MQYIFNTNFCVWMMYTRITNYLFTPTAGGHGDLTHIRVYLMLSGYACQGCFSIDRTFAHYNDPSNNPVPPQGQGRQWDFSALGSGNSGPFTRTYERG